jgi:hypothetical protein
MAVVDLDRAGDYYESCSQWFPIEQLTFWRNVPLCEGCEDDLDDADDVCYAGEDLPCDCAVCEAEAVAGYPDDDDWDDSEGWE